MITDVNGRKLAGVPVNTNKLTVFETILLEALMSNYLYKFTAIAPKDKVIGHTGYHCIDFELLNIHELPGCEGCSAPELLFRTIIDVWFNTHQFVLGGGKAAFLKHLLNDRTITWGTPVKYRGRVELENNSSGNPGN